MDTANHHDEDNVLFWVNKSGLPMDVFTWERMWKHVEKIHPDGDDVTRNIKNTHLTSVPMPQVPYNFPLRTTVYEKVYAVQKYMKDLQYNHTGTQFFEIRKNRPLSGLMEVAREMIRESLPIKCLEAIILGVYLTNGIPGLERFPLSFKSCFQGNYHRHVVLGVFHGGKFGAIGMSRRDDLAYKPLQFKTLSDLIFDFHDSYNKYWHGVKKTKVGLPISHDPHSFEQICWKTLSLNIKSSTRSETMRDIERHSKEIRAQSRLRDMYSAGGSLKKSQPAALIPSSPRKSLTYPPSPGKERTRGSLTGERTKPELRRSQSLGDSLHMKTDGSDLNDYQIRI